MFDRRTALILGAGASAPFGYPLGGDLVNNIYGGLLSVRDTSEGWESIRSSDDLFKVPYKTFLNKAFSNALPTLPIEFRQGLGPWTEFAISLRTAPSRTIDHFARLNPRFNSIIKLLIAMEIARHTFDANSLRNGQLQPRPLVKGEIRDTWYGHLVERLQYAFPSPKLFEGRPKLSVITFNYDRSLEQFLDDYWTHSESFSKMSWREAIAIIHVHGEVGVDQMDVQRPLQQHVLNHICSSANRLCLIDDDRPDPDPAMIARAVLDQAEEIIAIGFDFHQSNCNLIGLDQPKIAKKITALNFDGSGRFDKNAGRFGVAGSAIWKRLGQLYPITEAIDAGLLDP